MSVQARYSALLLFQYRVRVEGKDNKRRICEKRIISYVSPSPKDAYMIADNKGRSSENLYLNDDGNEVFFEFVGIMDLIELGIECEEDEVWYEVKEYLTPMERRKKLIPPKNKLIASVAQKKGD